MAGKIVVDKFYDLIEYHIVSLTEYILGGFNNMRLVL